MGRFQELETHFGRERRAWRAEAVEALQVAARLLQELRARWEIPDGALRVVPVEADGAPGPAPSPAVAPASPGSAAEPASEAPPAGDPAPAAPAATGDPLDVSSALRYRDGHYILPFVLTLRADAEPLEVRFDVTLRREDGVWHVDTGGEEDEYRLDDADPESWARFEQGFAAELREDVENAAWNRPEQAPRIGFRQRDA